MSNSVTSRRYFRIGLITIAAVYFLILVGGIVRASGAGMGCPDWPTCFGQWIPPTHESQLPTNYHQLYAERGYADTEFSAFKTWTEYVNRLIGVSIGVLILLTVAFAYPLRKRDPAVFGLSLGAFLLVGFQGWLGSAVVASNLKPAMITAHMVTAFLIVSLLIYAVLRSQRETLAEPRLAALPPRFRSVLIAAMAMTLLQIAMGTQIRESVDLIAVAFNQSDRHLWRDEFPIIFYIHRSFSSIILLTNGWLAWTLVRTLSLGHGIARFGVVLVGLVTLAILAGVGLDRLGFPAVVQPAHLVLANLIFGAQFALFVIYSYSAKRAEPSYGLSAQRG
ncbi:MAG: COX15/CtaA family protein [Methylotetracoccus sp.]|jgi:cytochrome c oxidase assembly protein subunit 15|nr:COX15/CtaA family protein [Methylotetracoccus sp.]